MRILFLTSAHNSLSQRLFVELTERGHEIDVSVVTTDDQMIGATARYAPDLIIAPMLKIAIPCEVYTDTTCLIVHPGIKSDRGPSSLDWAITNEEPSWGVTILSRLDKHFRRRNVILRNLRHKQIGGKTGRMSLSFQGCVAARMA